MGSCQQCVHFRRVKPASQLLGRAAGASDEAVVAALVRIQADEDQRRAYEDQVKARRDAANEEAWGFRPLMSDFCGLRESEETYLVAEVTNLGGRCPDMKAGPPADHGCNTCNHRVTPAANQGSGAARAFEVSGAYASKGIMATMPHFLDYCEKFSQGDAYVVCALRNPHNTCLGWEAGAGQATAKTTPTSTPAAVVPRLTPVPAVAPPPHAAPPPPPPMTPPAVAGPDPLTPAQFEDFAAFLEWILDVNLTPQVRQLLRDAIAEIWTTGDQSGMNFIRNSLGSFQEVKRGTPDDRIFWRESNQQAFVQQQRAADHPLSRALVQLYDAANSPIAPGEPPLTQECAETFAELLNFIQTVVAGYPPRPLPREARDDFVRQLTAAYGRIPPDQREFIAAAPLQWATVKATWPRLSEAEREGLRRQWMQGGGMGPGMGGMGGMAQAPRGPPRPSPDSWDRRTDFDSIPQGYDPIKDLSDHDQDPEGQLEGALERSAQRSEERVAQLEKEIAEAQAKGDAPKVAQLQVQLQREVQNQQQSLSAMSNIMSVVHQTNMSIIKNMGTG